MTHNITGSEAFKPSPHVLVRISRRGAAISPVAWFLIGATAAGVGASVLDVVTGRPFGLVGGLVVLAVWRIWPSRGG